MTVAALLVGAGRGERYRASLGERLPSAACCPRPSSRSRGGRCWCAPPRRSRRRPRSIVRGPGASRRTASRRSARLAPGLARRAEARGRGRGRRRAPGLGAGRARRRCPPAVRLVAVHDAARAARAARATSRRVVRGRGARAARRSSRCRSPTPSSACATGAWSRRRRARECWAAQTPQVFRVDCCARRSPRPRPTACTAPTTRRSSSGSASRCASSRGPGDNLKITTAADLAVAEALLAVARGRRGAAVRIGQGFDAHRLVPGRPLVLGGVAVPTSAASRATPTATCCCTRSRARCSARSATGDLGRHFPSSDPALAGHRERRAARGAWWRAMRAARLRGRATSTRRCRAGAAPRAATRRQMRKALADAARRRAARAST